MGRNPQQVAILIGDTVLYSTDGVMTFAPRVTDIATR